jgi:hypothetical protein
MFQAHDQAGGISNMCNAFCIAIVSVYLFVKTRLKAPAHPQDRKIDTTQNNRLNYTNSNNPPKISENQVLSCFLFRKMSGFQNPLALQTSGRIKCYLVSRSFGSKA